MLILLRCGLVLLSVMFVACQTIGHPEAPEYPSFRVQFVNPNNGWIIGDRMFRTDNGGKSWTELPRSGVRADDGPEYRKYYVQFVDSEWGWRVNGNTSGQLQFTNDGGRSWDGLVNVKSEISLSGVFFLSRDKGWSFGDRIYASKDRGLSWNEVQELRDLEHYRPFFLDGRRGWFAGRAKIAKTVDGGDTWTVYSNFPIEAHYVFFVSQLEGWAVGENGSLFFTNNGGETWSKRSLPFGKKSQFPRLLDVFFLNQQNGWISSADGRIFATTDAGKKWREQQTPTNAPLSSIYFIDESRGFCVGGFPEPATLAGTPSSVVIATTDKGSTWNIVDFD